MNNIFSPVNSEPRSHTLGVLQDDPLASGGGGAWGGAAGAGAGGFGSTPGQAAGGAAEEYDVVEITDDQLSGPTPSARVTPNVRSFILTALYSNSSFACSPASPYCPMPFLINATRECYTARLYGVEHVHRACSFSCIEKGHV